MKTFIVNSKDLLDSKKNPKLSLSPREILKNKKIKKEMLNEVCERCGGEAWVENFIDDYGFERLKAVCKKCGEEKII